MKKFFRNLRKKPSVTCKIEIKQIAEFDVENDATTKLARRWELWLQDFNTYVSACGLNTDEERKSLLLYMAGGRVRNIADKITTKNDNYQVVLKKIHEYFYPLQRNDVQHEVSRDLKPRLSTRRHEHFMIIYDRFQQDAYEYEYCDD